MPRCIICDSCSETDGGNPQSYRWNERENGFECRPCRTASNIDYSSKHQTDYYSGKTNILTGEEPILDTDTDTDLEGFELLAKPHVVRYSEDPED